LNSAKLLVARCLSPGAQAQVPKLGLLVAALGYLGSIVIALEISLST
jgi:hypothetical protein